MVGDKNGGNEGVEGSVMSWTNQGEVFACFLIQEMNLMMVSGIRWRIKEKTKTHLNIILNCMSGTMHSELKHFPLANKHNNMRLLKTKLLI